MSDRIPCEFSLIRYVPNVVSGEFVNIGVILRQVRLDGDGSADDALTLQLTRDWTRVQRIDPDADIQMLGALEAEFTNRLTDDSISPTALLADLRDTFSNSIQISEPRVSLAQTPALEIEELMRMYVEPH